MLKDRLFVLFVQLMEGKISENERRELLFLLIKNENREEAQLFLETIWFHYEPKQPIFDTLESEALLNKIISSGKVNNETISTDKEHSLWDIFKPMLRYAAVLLMILSVSVFFYKRKKLQQHNLGTSPTSSAKHKTEIHPSKNTAILTLSNGTKIDLEDVIAGRASSDAKINITKIADGQLVYTVTDPSQNSIEGSGTPEENTISTPRGAQCQINLPDGSKVWLNAESALKFPVAFVGNDRVVELTGEAYFEIKPLYKGRAKMPFKVRSSTKELSQEVEVLGTHFNVKSYPNEASVKTTLLEGSVRVANLGLTKRNILTPGQQSTITPKNIQISDADLEEVLAWKKGDFMFSHSSLKDIMRQLERWYDVDVNYDHVPNSYYYGLISRKVPLSDVLEMLEMTGDLKFKISKPNAANKNRIEIQEKNSVKP